MAMAELYRRLLSRPPAVEFASSEGKILTGPWRWFDESMLDCWEPLEKIKARGILFGKVVCLAHCAGAKVEAFRASHSSINEFRKYVMKCSISDDCHVISSYHRAALQTSIHIVVYQIGTGHFSPLGGYHAERDMVLILEVACFKYPPRWVPLTLLWNAMNTIDKATGHYRGFMLISRPLWEPGMLYTRDQKARGWWSKFKCRGESKACYQEVLKQVQEAGLFKHVASFLSNSCCGHGPSKYIGLHPASTDVLTVLLLCLPSITCAGIKDEQLLREMDGLVSIENLHTLQQDEVQHLRRQLHILRRCQEDMVDEDLGAPLP